MLPEETPENRRLSRRNMQLRAMAEFMSAAANPEHTHLRRRYVLAMALSAMLGIAMSVWLVLDSPVEEPTRPSYLPAD